MTCRAPSRISLTLNSGCFLLNWLDWSARLRLAPRSCPFLDAAREINEIARSEEHTSELQSQFHIVCRLLLEKKIFPSLSTHSSPSIASYHTMRLVPPVYAPTPSAAPPYVAPPSHSLPFSLCGSDCEHSRAPV